MKFLNEIRNSISGCHIERSNEFIDAGSLTNIDRLPEKPGVYILYSHKSSYTYPWHQSNVFYIGKADKSLHQRVILTHKKHMFAAKNNERIVNSIYYPIYEYAAAHGAGCMYTCCVRNDSAELEGELLARFATIHGAIPVANKKHDNFWHLFPADNII